MVHKKLDDNTLQAIISFVPSPELAVVAILVVVIVSFSSELFNCVQQKLLIRPEQSICLMTQPSPYLPSW